MFCLHIESGGTAARAGAVGEPSWGRLGPVGRRLPATKQRHWRLGQPSRSVLFVPRSGSSWRDSVEFRGGLGWPFWAVLLHCGEFPVGTETVRAGGVTHLAPTPRPQQDGSLPAGCSARPTHGPCPGPVAHTPASPQPFACDHFSRQLPLLSKRKARVSCHDLKHRVFPYYHPMARSASDLPLRPPLPVLTAPLHSWWRSQAVRGGGSLWTLSRPSCGLGTRPNVSWSSGVGGADDRWEDPPSVARVFPGGHLCPQGPHHRYAFHPSPRLTSAMLSPLSSRHDSGHLTTWLPRGVVPTGRAGSVLEVSFVSQLLK